IVGSVLALAGVGIAAVEGAGVLVVAADRRPLAAGAAGGRLDARVAGGAGVAVVAGLAGDEVVLALARGRVAGVPRADVAVLAVDAGSTARRTTAGRLGADVVPRAGVAVVAMDPRGRRGDAAAVDAGVGGAGVVVVAGDRLAGAHAVGIARVAGGAGAAV